LTLRSMTGFARDTGEADRFAWTWELRSVNGKGLDVRFRLPPGCETLEAEARKRCSAKLGRGNIQATLTIGGEALTPVPVLNEPALQAVLKIANDIQAKHPDIKASSVAELLGLRGVMEMTGPTNGASGSADGDAELPVASILTSLDTVLVQLVDMRSREGTLIAKALTAQLDRVTALHQAAVDEPSRKPEMLRKRLEEQIARVTGSSAEIDADRLHQEIALLATRADIQEELDRLAAHIDAARDLLSSEQPVGRRFEFLAQEFNRETNTICSKSNSTALTEIGLELKLVIDQFREQALNIE